MSWGERSCVFLYSPTRSCSPELGTCNVNCSQYIHDGKTTPDSELKICAICKKEITKDQAYEGTWTSRGVRTWHSSCAGELTHMEADNG
jgi:hypothetical protein